VSNSFRDFYASQSDNYFGVMCSDEITHQKQNNINNFPFEQNSGYDDDGPPDDDNFNSVKFNSSNFRPNTKDYLINVDSKDGKSKKYVLKGLFVNVFILINFFFLCFKIIKIFCILIVKVKKLMDLKKKFLEKKI
jgi:hypothetical protein